MSDEASPAPGRVLLLCGSTRDGSSNAAAVRAVHELELPGLHTDLYESLRDLPAFVPDEQPVPLPVTDLLDRIRAADAVLMCTPEYAGGLPGSLKNLLDWTVGGGELYDKPVAWIDVANPGRGAGARTQLGVVLGYVGARVVSDACVHVAVERDEARVRVAPAALPDLVRAVTALLGG
ncbi:MAG: NADPH-dependent FMN reductase [Blastococcus sp.]